MKEYTAISAISTVLQDAQGIECQVRQVERGADIEGRQHGGIYLNPVLADIDCCIKVIARVFAEIDNSI